MADAYCESRPMGLLIWFRKTPDSLFVGVEADTYYSEALTEPRAILLSSTYYGLFRRGIMPKQ
jgi:hypothetical protein